MFWNNCELYWVYFERIQTMNLRLEQEWQRILLLIVDFYVACKIKEEMKGK